MVFNDYLTDEQLKSYSVLMSVYQNDDPDYLRLAIESMLNQTKKPDQYVIVEDGPVSPEVEALITSYEEQFPQIIEVLRRKKNEGLGTALNFGLALCRNELVARMDADDISKRERCEKQLAYYKLHRDVGILGTQIEEFVGKPDNVVSYRLVPNSMEEIKKFAKRRSPVNHPTVMFRKTVIDALGGYSTFFDRKEDLDLFIRAVNENVILANLNESLLYYRTGDNNLERRSSWINCKEYIGIMYGFYKKGCIGTSDMMYVFAGQMFMYIMPKKIVKKISDYTLRKKNIKA